MISYWEKFPIVWCCYTLLISEALCFSLATLSTHSVEGRSLYFPVIPSGLFTSCSLDSSVIHPLSWRLMSFSAGFFPLAVMWFFNSSPQQPSKQACPWRCLPLKPSHLSPPLLSCLRVYNIPASHTHMHLQDFYIQIHLKKNWGSTIKNIDE